MDYRKRGMKAWLTGHVPPGRKFYYPSCFRRYALYTHSFRDVILGHLYGHNNMDHFFFLDADQALREEEEAEMFQRLVNEDDFDFTTLSANESAVLERLLSRTPESRAELLDSTFRMQDPDLSIRGAEDYIRTVKDSFVALPGPPKHPKKWKDGEKGEKQRKKYDKKVREYEENYQVVQVGPSIIPTYWTGIRVVEYNVSGLNGDRFSRAVGEQRNWTEWWVQMDAELAAVDDEQGGGLTIQAGDQVDEMKKKKKKKPRHPIHLPPEPHKKAPRGPVYEPQLFSPYRWEVHFVNLTDANAEHEADPSKPWDYGKGFFRLEYASSDAPYGMKDLSMRIWLDLAVDIAKEKVVKGGKEGETKKGKKKEKETYWDVFLRRAFINSGHHLDFDDPDD